MRSLTIAEFNLSDPQTHATAASIWNEACGPDFAITSHFVEFNTRPAPDTNRFGLLALDASRPVGFLIASWRQNNPNPEGWIDVVAVSPPHQRQGIGRILFDQAHAWLKERGCNFAWLGGSFRPFAPGLPVHLSMEPFFKMGYQQLYEAWDLARNLYDYSGQFQNPNPAAQLLPMQPGQEDQLLAFMAVDFPGDWCERAKEYCALGLRPSDWLLLWIEGKLRGFCCTTLEDSEAPLERYYPHRLPKPWGQVGTFGVAEGLRGRGYGLYLIHSSLLYLRQQGVNGCVIDWTAYVDLYGKFGFNPYNQYRMLLKNLE